MENVRNNNGAMLEGRVGYVKIENDGKELSGALERYAFQGVDIQDCKSLENN